MEGKLNAGDAKCPFFCAHTKNAVICEGLIPDSHVCTTFSGRENASSMKRSAACGMKTANSTGRSPNGTGRKRKRNEREGNMPKTIPQNEIAGGQDEKKRIAEERYIGGDVSLKALAAELGLSASTLGKWKKTGEWDKKKGEVEQRAMKKPPPTRSTKRPGSCAA